MNTILIGINAKYIHPNLAIRLLKANTIEPCDLKEFNIKDSIDSMYSFLETYDIIAFSCYIWNIEIIKALIPKLKEKQKIIILGGPEVSYNASHYIKNFKVDYVIKNEGEEAFDLLLKHIYHNSIALKDIPNLYYQDQYTFDKYVDLENANMAYHLLGDVRNQIVYIETSRGCPYHCGYCMASLDNRVRFFSIEKIKEELLLLIDKGARVFKFLDRTFNANKKNFIALIDFIVENHKDENSFQFEITGDLLDSDIIDYINTKAPKNLFRFEIGIQSTNILANQAVGRIQNNEKLFSNIRLIQEKNIIDLHLDLIAGLPYEDYLSFQNTFNEVLSLRPKELQLGFLKLLHGTRLHEERNKYDYRYLDCAPYEIIENKFMSKEDIKNIHITEEAFEKYYNSAYYKNSMKYILDSIEDAYSFFYKLGCKIKENIPKRLEDSFRTLDDYLKEVFPEDRYLCLHEELILEYLAYYNLKPKIWWDEIIDSKEKNKRLRYIKENYTIQESIDTLYKHSTLVETNNHFILAIYEANHKNILKIKK